MRSPYLLASVALIVSACSGNGHGGRHVQMPAADASPATVVRAYLAALNAHDRSTAQRLLAPRHRAIVDGEVDSPLTNVRSITNVRIAAVRRESGQGPNSRLEIVDVAVHFDLSQYRVESMPNGPTDWGYVLGRANPSDPWRIVDEGVG